MRPSFVLVFYPNVGVRYSACSMTKNPVKLHVCLIQAPGLIITPHIGGAVKKLRARGYQFVLAQIDRYLAGEPLQNVRVHGY